MMRLLCYTVDLFSHLTLCHMTNKNETGHVCLYVTYTICSFRA